MTTFAELLEEISNKYNRRMLRRTAFVWHVLLVPLRFSKLPNSFRKIGFPTHCATPSLPPRRTVPRGEDTLVSFLRRVVIRVPFPRGRRGNFVNRFRNVDSEQSRGQGYIIRWYLRDVLKGGLAAGSAAESVSRSLQMKFLPRNRIPLGSKLPARIKASSYRARPSRPPRVCARYRNNRDTKTGCRFRSLRARSSASAKSPLESSAPPGQAAARAPRASVRSVLVRDYHRRPDVIAERISPGLCPIGRLSARLDCLSVYGAPVRERLPGFREITSRAYRAGTFYLAVTIYEPNSPSFLCSGPRPVNAETFTHTDSDLECNAYLPACLCGNHGAPRTDAGQRHALSIPPIIDSPSTSLSLSLPRRLFRLRRSPWKPRGSRATRSLLREKLLAR